VAKVQPGISLNKNLEAGLDNGVIVIVPIPPIEAGEVTRWKCVLVDESHRNLVFNSLRTILDYWRVSLILGY
jgi:hypothetical protein